MLITRICIKSFAPLNWIRKISAFDENNTEISDAVVYIKTKNEIPKIYPLFFVFGDNKYANIGSNAIKVDK